MPYAAEPKTYNLDDKSQLENLINKKKTLADAYRCHPIC